MAVTEPVPQWLANWREQQRHPKPRPQPRTQRIAAPRQGVGGEPAPVSAVAEAARPQRPKGNFQGFVIPDPWPNDGGKRREAVLDMDHNPPRVVRHVGWRSCMTCRRPYFSEDVVSLRLCSSCKEPNDKAASRDGNRTRRDGDAAAPTASEVKATDPR